MSDYEHRAPNERLTRQRIMPPRHGGRSGRKFSPEYRAWLAMKERCYNPNYKQFSDYGGRGIKVCDRWLRSFSNVLEDMKEKPSCAHTMDRRDVNGNYTPDNCHWTTRKHQNRNRRDNVILEVNGEKRTMGEWAEVRGWKYGLIKDRLLLGWPVDLAVNTPPSPGKKLPDGLRGKRTRL